MMAVVSILVGLVLAFGAAQELVMRGVREGLLQPALLGAASLAASGLLVAAGVAARRRSPARRRLAIAAAVAIIAVHAYGMLPPHYNVGKFAALLAIAWGLVLLVVSGLRKPEATA
jgi:membrane associated rhomboid family serine protease